MKIDRIQDFDRMYSIDMIQFINISIFILFILSILSKKSSFGFHIRIGGRTTSVHDRRVI